MASDLSKKRGLSKLRDNPELFKSSSFRNKMKTMRRQNKCLFRTKWKDHKQYFMGITKQTYTAKDKHKGKIEGSKGKKLHMYENFFAMTANLRGINSCGERQILVAKWEREGIDAALLSETQKNKRQA